MIRRRCSNRVNCDLWENEINFKSAVSSMGIELLPPINLTKNVSKEKEKILTLVILPLKGLK